MSAKDVYVASRGMHDITESVNWATWWVMDGGDDKARPVEDEGRPVIKNDDTNVPFLGNAHREGDPAESVRILFLLLK